MGLTVRGTARDFCDGVSQWVCYFILLIKKHDIGLEGPTHESKSHLKVGSLTRRQSC